MSAKPFHAEQGSPDRLGSVYDGRGVNFAVFSAHATKIELCLFAEDGKTEVQRIALPGRTGDIWHGYVPGIKPGQLYGLRAHGPFEPGKGHRFDPSKLLLDPYAREIDGRVEWGPEHFRFGQDNAARTVKARVVGDMPPLPSTPVDRDNLFIGEMHVRGYTMTDPKVDQDLRGTVQALASAPVLDYLGKMHYTAVEFLPVMAKLHDERLEKEGLKNYWGYNTLGFFAVEPEYLKTGKRAELRDTVAALKERGIGVVLDIVFNHTAEGNHEGPTLSFRGLDNASYYKLDPLDRSRYVDETGCGNTLNAAHPAVQRLILDNLRMWVGEFGVAGFRFDLAPVLGRGPNGFDAAAPLFSAMAADPVLSKVLLIAEPWDCGPGGYQLGNFPAGWLEWNDRFRDDVRRFWREDAGFIGAKATRLSGSSAEFDEPGRTPQDSVNFVTCHDGFTLHDLVSYSAKKNHANGENNRDGNDLNHSSNHGAEGETPDPAVVSRREQKKRNLLASLFLAAGTPMMLAGDEFGNSQKGNNNAYCQDNPIGWLNWEAVTEEGCKLAAFTQKLAAFRRAHPVLQHDEFMHGRKTCGFGLRDIHWLARDGRDKSPADWNNPNDRCLGLFLNDGAVNGEGAGKRLLAVFNAASSPVDFVLPVLPGAATWERVIDTSDPGMEADAKEYKGSYRVPERATVVFVQTPGRH